MENITLKEIETIVHALDDENLDLLKEFIENEQQERKEFFVDLARETLRNCLIEIENDFGIYVVHEEVKIYVDDLEFYFFE